jgi:hypothetical protein
VRNMLQFNRALPVSGYLWRFAMERDALWRKVVDIKYCSMRGGWCSKEVGGPYGVKSVEMYKEEVACLHIM